MGRQHTYTEELIAEICTRIANGETLRAVCREEGMPAWTTFYNWINASPDLAERFAHARLLGADAIAEETIAMIDEKPERCDTQFGDKVDAGYVQWQKNRVEQRLKLLAKWFPQKYGERQAVELSNPDGTLRPSDEATQAVRLAAIMQAAQQRKAEDDVSDLM